MSTALRNRTCWPAGTRMDGLGKGARAVAREEESGCGASRQSSNCRTDEKRAKDRPSVAGLDRAVEALYSRNRNGA